MRKFNKDEIADMDFNAYLATSSEEEERDDDDITSADKNDVINEDLKDEEDEKVMKYRVCWISKNVFLLCRQCMA